MQIDGSPQNVFGQGMNPPRELKPEGQSLNSEILDSIKLGEAREDNSLINMFKLKDMAPVSSGGPASTPFSILAITFPDLSITQKARHDAPVVIVHGTMSDEKSIQKYMDATLQEGHPTDLFTYLSIKDGQPLEKSGQIISEHVNSIRMSIAKRHLEELAPYRDNLDGLKKKLLMDDRLYDNHDEKVDKVAALVPDILDKLGKILKGDEDKLKGSFSSKTKDLEAELAKDIKKTGFADGNQQIAGKLAAEIMDAIVPKAVLVGHSMGGFVSYAMAINPKEKGQAGDPFKYDAGNGVSTVITLSSPVGKGVRRPLPKGIENYIFDLTDKNMLKPMEDSPGMQLAQMNPFFSIWYNSAKAIARETYRQSMIVGSAMSNPMIYLMKPGVEQISEGSEFIRKYIDHKKIPSGTTVIAVSNKDDGISEQASSKVDESQPNAYNLDADVNITAEDLKDPKALKATRAHLKMAQYPFEHGDEFRHEVLENPDQIPKLLDQSNYDGIRWRCLSVLYEDLAGNPDLFKNPEFKPALDKIKEVAAEKLPFKDSASYVAMQILKMVEHD